MSSPEAALNGLFLLYPKGSPPGNGRLQADEVIRIDCDEVSVQFTRKRGAKRYILRVTPERTLKVTVPWQGNRAAARQFVERHIPWIRNQLLKKPHSELPWVAGSLIWYRGTLLPLEVIPAGEHLLLKLGAESWKVEANSGPFRHLLGRIFRALAEETLPRRVMQLAEFHRLEVRRVTIRNQKTRWGSCSARRTISLNWRLIQAPDLVIDYIIIHELMHLQEMNHSEQFWKKVEAACPEYRAAEQWLKAHGRELM
ncbi:MAG: SprT family zinc-dependent metalloprotease [Verrucomicrobiota bacterium]|nr:SprT family zinc-dependent metalloprotease [Verrucomicrobiota bacterium]